MTRRWPCGCALHDDLTLTRCGQPTCPAVQVENEAGMDALAERVRRAMGWPRSVIERDGAR